MKYKIIAIGNRDGFHGWKSMIGRTGTWKRYKEGSSQEGYMCGWFTFDDAPKKMSKSFRGMPTFFHAVKVERLTPGL